MIFTKILTQSTGNFDYLYIVNLIALKWSLYTHHITLSHLIIIKIEFTSTNITTLNNDKDRLHIT